MSAAVGCALRTGPCHSGPFGSPFGLSLSKTERFVQDRLREESGLAVIPAEAGIQRFCVRCANTEQLRCGSRAACAIHPRGSLCSSLKPGAAQLVQLANGQVGLRQCSRAPPASAPVLGSFRRGNVKNNGNIRRNSRIKLPCRIASLPSEIVGLPASLPNS